MINKYQVDFSVHIHLPNWLLLLDNRYLQYPIHYIFYLSFLPSFSWHTRGPPLSPWQLSIPPSRYPAQKADLIQRGLRLIDYWYHLDNDSYILDEFIHAARSIMGTSAACSRLGYPEEEWDRKERRREWTDWVPYFPIQRQHIDVLSNNGNPCNGRDEKEEEGRREPRWKTSKSDELS